MAQDTDFFGGTKGVREIQAHVEQEAINLAAGQGFTLRQPLREPPKRKRGTALQLHNFTMRLHIDDMERFISWCDGNRLTYREGFQRLTQALPEVQKDERAA